MLLRGSCFADCVYFCTSLASARHSGRLWPATPFAVGTALAQTLADSRPYGAPPPHTDGDILEVS